MSGALAEVALRLPSAPRLRASLAFAGPAFLVSVGYMDPGNWGTDLAAGSRYGPALLWVLVVSNAIAVFLQYLSAKLGIATGDHLASLLGQRLGRRSRVAYWLVVEVAMLATEMAEFLGVVVALRLLLGIGLVPAIALGAVAVLGLLGLGRRRARPLERAIFALITVVGACYVLELWLSSPPADVVAGLVPRGLSSGAVVVAMGMLGATVMPHNLFLHSGLILSRLKPWDEEAVVLRRATTETAVGLNLALLVNGAILVMAASTFHPSGIEVDSLDKAHRTLEPLLGQAAAGAFALALLAAGLASSVTGGMAGQMVLDGFLNLRVSVMARRAVTMVPAIVVLAVGVDEVAALVWSQVVLSLVLPAVAGPLVRLTGDRSLMGALANRRRTRWVGIGVVSALTVLNGILLAAVAL